MINTASPFLDGMGLMAEGLFYKPLNVALASLDGSGLETSGFIFNASIWSSFYQIQNVPWIGCSTCPTNCS